MLLGAHPSLTEGMVSQTSSEAITSTGTTHNSTNRTPSSLRTSIRCSTESEIPSMASCRDLAANPHSSPGAIHPVNLLLPGTESDGPWDAVQWVRIWQRIHMSRLTFSYEYLASWPPCAVGRLHLSHVGTVLYCYVYVPCRVPLLADCQQWELSLFVINLCPWVPANGQVHHGHLRV